jgi:hypothetical protein
MISSVDVERLVAYNEVEPEARRRERYGIYHSLPT